VVLRQLVYPTSAVPWYAVLSKELFQLSVLLCEGLLVARDHAVVLLQAKNFLLEGLDI
jgi:hypothetical protein